jgi:uncharacterized protein YecE (DUF72 family)
MTGHSSPTSPGSSPSSTIEADRAQRRQRRKDRREKQRLANVGRAAAMHDARLHLLSSQSTERSNLSSTASIHKVGCSGWFYWDWRGGFYPEKLPTRQWFSHYAQVFKTVELNAPFYSWPTVSTVRTWVRQAGRRKFVYSVKVSELITHVKQFKGTKTLIKDFGLIADLLDQRMGCFLFQLPPSFHYSPAALRRIVGQLDPARKNVVEFRHASWWRDSVYRAFEKEGIIFCSCSAPRLPDELIKTAQDIYIRFHGTKRWYRHDYTDSELKMWSERIRTSSPKTVWAYFNNDHDMFAIKNAKRLRSLLKSGL